ncbi:acyl-CoA dehydrogenase FadE [Neiella marina]|uniref:Acyl-coenzyme A dehydrogenase n=1 Tax=Neiella holothuriorum TaxID=2870530 RepID=A0ABS7EIM4_9GAMM|nr:acyl-CoA dehydrogenase FadE [Neiella holothuriorum]MBW8192208.1 acyl-CoA dehydrogenase FadE [Neiella holothuriorum]
MEILVWSLSLIAIIGVVSYQRQSLLVATLATATWLAFGQFVLSVPAWSWLIWAALLAPLNLTSIRRSLLSQPMLRAYRGIMPEMSTTERDAIAAGTTWWEGELFRGNPDWQTLHRYPAPKLSTEEQAFIDGPVETVCQMTNDFEITHERADLPPEIWQYLKDNGFFAMIIKKQYGGLEFSAYAQSYVLQKLATVSGVLASTVGVPNSLGPGELLQHYGTDEQKNHYLPRLAKGQEIPCFALTSPEAGSDAGAIPDRGTVCMGDWKGQQVLGMRLTWNKRYITLAPVATVLGLAFKLDDPEQLLGGEKELGITCALIPTDTQGVDIGRRHFPLNIPFQNGPTHGTDVFVPIDYIIGGQTMAGQGWRMLVECLSVGRGITLPANATGGAKMAAMATSAYARIRRQFKVPIGYLEGIEEPMARIAGSAYLMDAAANLTTTAIDLGEKPSVISAIVKYHLTNRGQQAIIDAMDIQGGKGICMGPSNYLARAYQGAPIAVTVEGANILTRSMIIYGQGAIRCHPYVLAELEAASLTDQNKALADFDKAVFGHIGFAISNVFRCLWFGWGGYRFTKSPQRDVTASYYRQLNRYSANLALLSDIAMATLGGSLKRRERVSARLGDLLSELYLSSAVLKRFDNDGRPAEDLPLVQWALDDSLARLRHSLRELLDNFPVAGVGGLLKVLIMPFGLPAKRAGDKLDHQVAKLAMTPSDTRDRLGHMSFLTDCDTNPVGTLQATLHDIIAAEALVAKVSQAKGEKVPFIWLDKIAEEGLQLGVLNESEVQLLKRAEEGRMKAINVDDFDPQELVADKSTLPRKAQQNAA